MKFPGKKTRSARGSAHRDIDFEHYSWDTPREKGWHPLVVLNAKESETGRGDPMWVIDFGIDLPSGDGTRIRWHVPSTFAPKVAQCMEVLLAEYLDQEDDIDIDPKVMMFRDCVGLVDVDENYQREDGEPSWALVKIIKTEDAEESLGADWLTHRGGAGAAVHVAEDEADVF